MLFHRFRLSLQWRHNECDGVSNYQPLDYLLNRLFRRRSKKTSKLRVTGLCAGNSPVTGEFPAQRASNAENVFIWWRHHVEVHLNALCHNCEMTSRNKLGQNLNQNTKRLIHENLLRIKSAKYPPFGSVACGILRLSLFAYIATTRWCVELHPVYIWRCKLMCAGYQTFFICSN